MKNDTKFVRDSNSGLKLITLQLSNVRELETNKYAHVARSTQNAMLSEGDF